MKYIVSLVFLLFSIQSIARPTPFPYYKCVSDLSMIKDDVRIHDYKEIVAGAVPYSHTLGSVQIPHNLDGRNFNLAIQIDMNLYENDTLGESALYHTEDYSKNSSFELIGQKISDIFGMRLVLTLDDENIIAFLKCQIIPDVHQALAFDRRLILTNPSPKSGFCFPPSNFTFSSHYEV